jgi:hypothetical protein
VFFRKTNTESYQILLSKPIYNKRKINQINSMPKKAYLSSHLSSDELKQKYLKSQDSIESRRWHLLWKVSLGWTIKNSAVAIGINYDYAKEIVSKYNHLGEKGVENLKNKVTVQGNKT